MILDDFEINANTCHTYIIQQEYLSRYILYTIYIPKHFFSMEMLPLPVDNWEAKGHPGIPDPKNAMIYVGDSE